MILVVDDDSLLLRALKRIFKGCEVAPDLVGGLALARRHQPEVVLLDVRLGNDDGINAIGDFLAACPHAKIVVFTAHTNSVSRIQAFRAGASAYIDKMHLRRIDEIIDEVVSAGGLSKAKQNALH